MPGVVAGSSDHLENPLQFRAHGLLKFYWQLLPYRINPIVDRFINALSRLVLGCFNQFSFPIVFGD
jgi:hypothetical protein